MNRSGMSRLFCARVQRTCLAIMCCLAVRRCDCDRSRRHNQCGAAHGRLCGSGHYTGRGYGSAGWLRKVVSPVGARPVQDSCGRIWRRSAVAWPWSVWMPSACKAKWSRRRGRPFMSGAVSSPRRSWWPALTHIAPGRCVVSCPDLTTMHRRWCRNSPTNRRPASTWITTSNRSTSWLTPSARLMQRAWPLAAERARA